MKDNTFKNSSREKRSDPRIILDRYYSVEFRLKETASVYQFKLRDMSSNGLGILVNKDSAVLQYLKAGNTLDMKYVPPKASGLAESLKTQIIHITQKDEDPFKGHFLIGLLIIERQAV